MDFPPSFRLFISHRRDQTLNTPPISSASSRSSRSSYIASTNGLNRQGALDFAGRRDRLALFLGIEHLRQDTECLDLLDAGELRVGLVDLVPDQLLHLRVLRETGEPRIDDVVAARPIRNRVEVDFDEGGNQ
jgi:hypothetical protein